MKQKIIYYFAAIVVLFMVYTVAQANYEIILRADPIKFIGEKYPSNTEYSELKRLYKEYTPWENTKAIIKALGYSLATILIIIFYRSIYIKILFVLLDSAIIFIYLRENYEIWFKYGSYIYAIYTGLIILFVGLIATKLLKDEKQDDLERNKLPKNISDAVTFYMDNKDKLERVFTTTSTKKRNSKLTKNETKNSIFGTGK